MSVAVHVRVGVRRRRARQVERVFPAEVEQDRLKDEDSDHNSVADEFVRDHGLDKQREKSEGQNLREGDDVELLEILQDFVVVISSNGLHDDADQHGNGQQDDFHQRDGGELGKPVGASRCMGSAS